MLIRCEMIDISTIIQNIRIMIKGIIEKIIMSTFGKFIKGIGKDKLSVDLFGGNFKLQNISLNHQFFNDMNMPFRLAFSSIGTLNLQAPLSKLSSVPVQCVLQNIYVILQFKEGTGQTSQKLRAKKDKIFKEVGQVLESSLKKIKDEKKEDGMMSRLGKKIVDNLQLKIKNVHIRFEQENQTQNYAWGLTLEEINFTTTDKDWKPCFIQRTAEGKQKLFKMMSVKNFNLYWETGINIPVTILKSQKFKDGEKKERLAQLIQEEKNVVFSITSEFKLVINPPEDIDSPIYEMQVCLEPLKFQFERVQLIQMADFARKNVIKNEMIVKSIGKKSKIKMTEQQKGNYREQYEQFINQVLNCHANNKPLQSIQGFDDILVPIFQKIEDSELTLWQLGPVKNKVKDIREKEIKKKKGGWFSKGPDDLSEKQRQELQKFIDQSFEGQKYRREPHLLFFRINTELKGGKMVLVQFKGQDIEESIEFNIGKITSSLSKSEDQSFFQSFLEIESINLNLFIPIQKNNITKQKKMEIFTTNKPEEYKQDSDEDSMKSFDSVDEEEQVKKSFLKIVYKTQFLDKNTVLKKTIQGNMEKVIVVYKQIYMQKFKKFFSFKKANLVKAPPIQQYQTFIEEDHEQQQQTFKLQKILDVRLNINSPIFICPLNETECWCLHFGSLNIKSNRNEQFQQFPMVVNSAFLRYYPFMKQCYQIKQNTKKGVFSLINDMDFMINYQQFKQKNQEILNIDLPSFKVNFTQQQYENLMSLTKIFKVEQDEKRSMVEQLKQERKQIEQNKNYEGIILKKQETLMSWKIYHGILSGQYLYLYNDRKQLKENTKFYMKNAKSILLTNQVDEQNQEIQLINEHQIWYVSSQTKEELSQWSTYLDKKCKQFKTIHELMKDYQIVNQKSNKKEGTQSQTSDHHLAKRKILKFTVSQVQFRYINNEEDSLMQFKVQEIYFSRQNMHQWSQKVFTMKMLLITDKIHKFKNPIYQKLIQAYGVSFQQLKGKKKMQGKRKSNIILSVQQLFVNWKPDVLLLLMQLMNKHFKGQKIHRLDDDIEQSRQEHFNQVYTDTKFMTMMNKYKQKSNNIKVKNQRQDLSLKPSWMKETMVTDICLNKIQINMIHRESHINMLKMQSQKINCLFQVCQSQKFLKGTIDTLDVFDMTGYPQKDYSSDQDYPPYKIMTKVKDNDQPFMQFRWSSYDANNFPNQQKVDSFMWVNVAPLYYEYYQQITFRIVDYLLIQVILLINQPQMLTVNQNLMEQLKHQVNVEQKPIKILFSQYEQIIKKLIHPSFMDMFFKLEQPIFVFKAQKTSHIYYKLTIQDLTFYNQINKSSKRFQKQCKQVKDLIYEEQFIINGKDCRFIEIVQSKNKEEQLFQPFKIQIQFNKLLFQDEINLIFPEISNYDRSFVTINKISTINIPHYSRLQYLNINKLVNFNFTFDDQCDQLFIHNFKVTKLLSPKPIFYQVIVPEIHMTADYNARENNQQIWKLFKASIYTYSMEYRRTKQLNSSFTISLGLTQFRGFQYKLGMKEPIEHYLLSLCGQELGKTSTDIMVENQTTGRKLINMNIAEMNVTLRTGLFQLILEYTLIQDWVFPQVNKFVPELIFCATVCKMHASLSQDVEYVASQLIKKRVSQKVIKDVLNHKFGLGTFILDGVLCYKFHRRRDSTIQEYQNKLARKEISFPDFQKMQAVTSMSAILNTQIYRSWTTSQAKRKIIDKFTFTYEDKRFLKVADEDECLIKTSAKRGISIDHWQVKVSFKDIILMMKILNQISQERKYITYLNQKTGKDIVANLNPFKQTQSSSLQSLDLSIQNLSFYLLNARRDIFIPILKVVFNRINLGKSNTFKKDIFKGDFGITVYYFNNLIFRWQPMLQKTNIFFHKLTYYQQNNTVFGSAESQGPIMINISRQIFSTIKQTADAWKKQSEQEENKYISESKDIEPLTFVSHYIVRNQTGYPIDILNQKGNLIKTLRSNDQMDYEYQINDYDQQTQPQIFIGFLIHHPMHNFMAIKNITFSNEKQYEIIPKLAMQGHNPIINTHSKIIIKPQIKQCKKILMIKSSKYVYYYYDGDCQKEILPFDHDIYYTLPKQIHNKMKVSLYEEKSTDYYRYVGKDGILKIMKKYLVYNYCPIPLQICGKIVKPDDYVGISQKLKIQDIYYKDSILKVIKNQKNKEFYIYAQCYIIDYYGLSFQFQKQYRNIPKMYSYKFNTPDCNYVVYLLPQAEFKFKVSMGKDSSIQSVKTTIGKVNFILENKKALCPFSVYSYLSPLENQQLSQFRRIIEITPQYMLSNATKNIIKICQIQSCDSISLQPYQRIPFIWQSKFKPKRIKLALYDGTDFWGYSGDLTIQSSTESIVLRKMSDPTTYRILSIQVEITNTVTFIHIVLPSSPKYTLSNTVPGTTLLAYQHAILDQNLDHEHSFPKQFIFNVEYGQEQPFGYQLPLESHSFDVKVELDQSLPQYKGVTCDIQIFDDMQTTLGVKTLLLRNQKRRIVAKLWIILCFQDNIKKLKLQRDRDEEQIDNTYEYILKIPRIGISFIGAYGQLRRQIVHVMFDLIQMNLSGNADYNDLNLLVSRCRIQNQLKYDAFFPVIFQSVHTKEAKYFLNFLVNRSGKNTRLIHYIGISINKSWLTVTSQEVQILQQNFRKIMLLNSGNQSHVRKIQMFNKHLPDPEESIFFVESVIHPLRSNITFKHVNQWGGRLLKTFSSINQCPVSAQGLKFKQFSCPNMGAYFSHLVKHYQDGMSKMLLPMIGNLTILGSPITFVQKIGSGFKDLVQLPAEGFEISPLEGSKGVARGAASLLTKTISGTFNTVESLTGSLSNGLTLLVDDDKTFTRQRQQIKNDRSNHVIGGLVNGGKSIAYGFKNGFTGVVTQPIQGAEKNGLPGFLLGAAKGIGGLVIKPISGVIDAASKTAEGIKNTPQFFSDERKQKFTRERNPRPFYNYYKQFRNYDYQLSELIRVLFQQDEKYSNLSWCGHYELISQKPSSKPFLILSYEYLLIFDIKKKKLVQRLRCDSFISVFLVENDYVRIKVWDKKKQKEGYIQFLPESGCKKIAYEINVIIRHFTPNFIFV